MKTTGASSTEPSLAAVLAELHAELLAEHSGKVASYIPELARVDPDRFGIALVAVDGRSLAVGDAELPFTIQSASKPFVYGMAVDEHGRDRVLAKIGVQPVEEAFNAIALDEATNRPFNPMINAGAIAATDLLGGDTAEQRLSRLLAVFERGCGHPVEVDEQVFASERATGERNRALAHLMRSFGMIGPRLEETLELYFRQCSIKVTCRDLAMLGATLANQGVNPVTGERMLSTSTVRDVLSVMHGCGMYNFSGEWDLRIGIPAKSGVGGGIVGVVPGLGGIATFSPRLDEKGNSVRGIAAFRILAERFHLHLFDDRQLRDETLARFGE
jgi:glutaminase